jgi:UPF0755 protein
VIDPLIKIRKTEEEPAENWYDDPWDSPDALRRSEQLEVDTLPNDFRGLSRPFQIVAVAVATVTLFMGAIGLWYVHRVNPSGKGDPQSFTVVEGDSIASVSQRLADEGFVSSASVFDWYVSRKGGIELIPGYYTIAPKDHMGNIMAVLKTPPSATYQKVTFPEGYTIAQMGARLAEKTLRLNAEQFIAMANDPSIESPYRPEGQSSLEGLLFPDTYQVSGDGSEARVVSTMAGMMQRVARQVDLKSGAKIRGFSQYQILIIASLIEREAKISDDRSKIAQVIYNRLAAKMPLEIDAAVKYGQDPAMTWTEMKATDTPYNTYINKGLPPTPIANPGRASIQAALAPAGAPPKSDEACVGLEPGVKCQYLFYVLATAEGGHAFSTTYEQHLAKVAIAKAAGLLP